MNKNIFIVGIIILISGLLLLIDNAKNDSYVVINKNLIGVEIAETLPQRTRGLSGRVLLEQNRGILFIFPNEDKHEIWMKEMLFNIDIVWIDRYGFINYIKEDISPNTFPKTFSPPENAKYVLELNANYIKENDIKVGDKVFFGF